MRVCIESAFICELFLNVMALLSAVRHSLDARPARILAAAFLGASVSSVAAICAVPRWCSAALCVICVPAMLAIAGVRRRGMAGAAASLMSVSALMACVSELSPVKSYAALLFAGALGAAVSTALDGKKRRWLATWEARVRLINDGRVTYLNAFIDTGNHLREPISGICVMPVTENLLRGALPEGFAPSRAMETLPAGFRLIGYGGVGGVGEMGCFMPERAEFFRSGRWQNLDSVWIAVYPGKLPGGAEALMPPCIM